jgi:uroporphyrinogen decarboxylase
MGMSGRRRFIETMSYGRPDRPPFFEEGIRADVLQTWQEQGLAPGSELVDLFHLDRREEIFPVLDPKLNSQPWPRGMDELERYRRCLNPQDPERLPADWSQKIENWQNSTAPLLLRVHRGLFETLGIMDWRRFSTVMFLLKDDPDFVRELMIIHADFVCQLIARILREVRVDAVIFSEPISDNNNPLVSPRMFVDLALSSYRPILDLVRAHGVETIIFRTYANARILLPPVVRAGFNCLWACETNAAAMDYSDIRAEFGRDLRLIGGIDTDVLRQDKNAIRREVEEKVPPLLAEGGFIPLADGRVRADISYENYRYYRQVLETVVAH